VSSVASAVILWVMLASVALIAWSRPISWTLARWTGVVPEAGSAKRASVRGPGELVYLLTGVVGLSGAVIVLLLGLNSRGQLSAARVVGALFIVAIAVAWPAALEIVAPDGFLLSPWHRPGSDDFFLRIGRAAIMFAATALVWEILRR